MQNTYDILKEKHQKEIDAFPIYFAFGEKQLEETFKKINLKYPEDIDKVSGIGYGGFVKKEDAKAYIELINKLDSEIKKEIDNDKSGENFIKDMFYSELLNHEYGYTRDITDTLDALGIAESDLKNNVALKHGLDLAVKKIIEYEDNIEL